MRVLPAVAAAAVVLAATWPLALPDPPLPGEAAAFEAVNGLPGGVLYGPVVAVMQLGSVWLSPLVAAVLVALRLARHRPPPGRVVAALRVAVAAPLAAVAAWWLVNQAKQALDRPRPSPAVVDLVEREGRHGLGYPSGHAAVAAALAVVAAAVLPARWGRWRWAVPATVAALVGLARVYVGVHYPLDLLGGWALGTLVGVAVVAVTAPAAAPAAVNKTNGHVRRHRGREKQ